MFSLLLGSCYSFKIDENKSGEGVTQLFNFKDSVKYYQKSLNDKTAQVKNGAGIVGNGLTWGRDRTIVVGSPNFNLGDPKSNAQSKGWVWKV